MRRLPLDRLHDTARRQVRRDTQQQMHMLGTHVALQNLDVIAPTNLRIKSRTWFPISPRRTGLRYFVMNTKS